VTIGSHTLWITWYHQHAAVIIRSIEIVSWYLFLTSARGDIAVTCIWVLLSCSVQEYFVKRANRGLLPSTHLIVSAADGSKYNAAKKWKLPAVSKLYVDL